MEDGANKGAVETPREAAERQRRPLLLLFSLVVALLYVQALNPHWRFQRDSAIYLDLGRSMLEGRGYMHNYRWHMMYLPGYPAMLTATGAVAGMPETLNDSFLASNAMGMVLGLGCVLLFFFLLQRLDLTARQAGILLVLFAFSRTLYYYSFHLMTDVPYTFFALGSLLCGLLMLETEGRTSWMWCGAAAGLALVASLVRPLGPFLVPALVAGLWLRHGGLGRWRANLGKSLLISVAVVLPLAVWMLWMRASAPETQVHYITWTRNRLTWERLASVVSSPVRLFPEHMEGIADTICGSNLGVTVGVILSVVLLVGLVAALRRGHIVLSFYAIINIAVIIAGGWDLARRYLVPVVPVLLLWLVLGGSVIGRWMQRRRPSWDVARIGYVLTALLLAVNLLRIGDFVLENRSPDFYARADKGRMADYMAVHQWLRQNAEWDDTVLGYEATTLHYFSRVRTAIMPRDTTDRKTAWFIDYVERRGGRYLVADGRLAESTAVAGKLADDDPIRLEHVLDSGQVKLYRIVRRARDAAEPGSQQSTTGNPVP